MVSRYMEDPKQVHLLAVKRLFRYIKGTLGCGVYFPVKKADAELKMVGYTDAD